MATTSLSAPMATTSRWGRLCGGFATLDEGHQQRRVIVLPFTFRSELLDDLHLHLPGSAEKTIIGLVVHRIFLAEVLGHSCKIIDVLSRSWRMPSRACSATIMLQSQALHERCEQAGVVGLTFPGGLELGQDPLDDFVRALLEILLAALIHGVSTEESLDGITHRRHGCARECSPRLRPPFQRLTNLEPGPQETKGRGHGGAPSAGRWLAEPSC
mmetsp:Transcript_4433/g.10768  ORF Transcript_4433/g.10768 Transcript_4433/m.10768 type:complete len:214 (+) Transcript_4433:1671-2312(+)